MKLVLESVDGYINEEKNPDAKIRNRGDVILPSTSKLVKDDADHYPINTIGQARNALARVNQYDSSPTWFDGTLKSLITKVTNAVQKKYPSIEVSKK